MAKAPLYTSEVGAPTLRPFSITPQDVPRFPDGRQVAHAANVFGATLARLGETIAEAGNEAEVANAKTGYMTKLAELEQRYASDPDYETATERFKGEVETLKTESLGTISNPLARTKAGVSFTTLGLSATHKVFVASRARLDDAQTAGLVERSNEYLRRAAAGSPAERSAIVKEWHSDIDGMVSAGFISAERAGKLKNSAGAALDDRDALELIRRDPRQAKSLLADPTKFPGLDPVHRQIRAGQADDAVDRLGVLELGALAVTDPARASATIGRVLRPADGDTVFRSGIMPTENAKGDNALVSNKGAVGVTQILPGTAREVAAGLGLKVFDGLDDAAITKKLIADKGLNFQLGRTYWTQMLARYQAEPAQIAVAAAAYNAGPGRADAWVKAAREKFGPGYTPAQFQSVIGIAETHAYVGKVYGKLNADMGYGGLSPVGQLHAATRAATVADAEAAARKRVILDMAETGRAIANPALLLKDGLTPDPNAVATYRHQQAQAATLGSLEAAKALRDLEFRERMFPVVRGMQRLTLAQAEAAVADAEAAIANAPAVTNEMMARRDAMREVLSHMKTKAKDNPVGLAETSGLVPPSVIDPAVDPTEPAAARELAQRGHYAVAAADFYGTEIKPFKPQEAAALKQKIADAPEGEKHRLIAGLAGGLGNERAWRAAVDQLGLTGVERTAGMVALDRPQLARQILHGAEILKTPAIEKKAETVREAVRAKLGGEIYPSPDMQADVINAALAVYAAERGTNGALYDPGDSGALERAIEAVTGPIISRNGARVPVAPGLTPAQFRRTLDKLEADDLARFGGAYDRDGKPLDGRQVGEYGILKPLTPGGSRYAVLLASPDGRGAPVLAYDGGADIALLRPLVIDMRELGAAVDRRLAAAPAPALTPYQAGRRRFRDQLLEGRP